MKQPPMKLVVCLSVAVAGGALAAAADAAGRLDDKTVEAFGGSYAADCRKAASVHAVVAADRLAVEGAGKRVESHDVQRAVTYAGGGQPAGYQGSLFGDVPGGQPLVFHVHRDAKGLYLVVDADTKLESTFGKAAFAPKFRSCDAAQKSAAPANPPASHK
jgi:hypothetical protein